MQEKAGCPECGKKGEQTFVHSRNGSEKGLYKLEEEGTQTFLMKTARTGVK